MICRKCVMDTTDPEITFTESGCTHCDIWHQSYQKIQQTQIPLSKLFDSLKTGKQYDAILGVSGGLDSSYTAYLAHQYGVNCLLVHFDNGYNTDEGTHNIETIAQQTGWPLKVHTMDLAEFYDMQHAYLKAGVKNLEALTDHAIKADLFHTVHETGVKNVLSGSNWVTEGILPVSWGSRNDDQRNIIDIHRRHGKIPRKTYPVMDLVEYAVNVKLRGVQEVKPLNHIFYDVEKAAHTLRSEWGWREYGWKHHESRFTRFYQAYVLPYRWGVDKRRAHLSTMICSHQVTRDAALDILKISPYPYPEMEEDRKTLLEKLDIQNETLQVYLDQPHTPHTRYKTNKGTLAALRLMRRLLL